MWDDTTPRAKQIAKWLDEPFDLDKEFGGPYYRRRKRQRKIAREKLIRKLKAFCKKFT